MGFGLESRPSITFVKSKRNKNKEIPLHHRSIHYDTKTFKEEFTHWPQVSLPIYPWLAITQEDNRHKKNITTFITSSLQLLLKQMEGVGEVEQIGVYKLCLEPDQTSYLIKLNFSIETKDLSFRREEGVNIVISLAECCRGWPRTSDVTDRLDRKEPVIAWQWSSSENKLVFFTSSKQTLHFLTRLKWKCLWITRLFQSRW